MDSKPKKKEDDPLAPILPPCGSGQGKFTPQDTYRYTGEKPGQVLSQVMARQRRDAEAEAQGKCGQIWYRTTNKHKWWCGFHVSTGVLFYSFVLLCSAIAQGFAFYVHKLHVPIAILPLTACAVLMSWIGLASHSTRWILVAAICHFVLFVGAICATIQLASQYEHHQFDPHKIVHELGLVVTNHLAALVVQSMVAFFNTLNCLSYRTAVIIDEEVERERVRAAMIDAFAKDSMV